MFCTFFPYIVSGPITRYNELVPQLDKIDSSIIDWEKMSQGLYIFSIGLFKKIIIADNLAVWVNNGFDNALNLNFFEAWATSLAYTMQLYFDFSGYTDMAIGSALMLCLSLPANFNSPYRALSMQDFWRRWHITLGRFMRDYIYIPLGGNKCGKFATYKNLLLTFILGGIWHGAGWNFILWGTLHGFGIIIHRIWKIIGMTLPNTLAWFITFNFVNVCWVFFRAQDISTALKILREMFFPEIIPLPFIILEKFEILKNLSFIKTVKNPLSAINGSFEMVVFLILSFSLVLFFKNSFEKSQGFSPSTKTKYFIVFLILYSIINIGEISKFLYVQF